MTDKIFAVSNLQELRVMQRVFREAKFCLEADDEEISASPIVAKLFTQLMNVLIAIETETEADSARRGWTKWLDMSDSSRDEWTAALKRAKSNVQWPAWSQIERLEYSKTLFSPFVLTEERLRDFVTSV